MKAGRSNSMPQELQAWLEPIRELEVETESLARQSERRSKVLPGVAAAIRRVPNEARRQRYKQGFWWAAAAATVLAVGGLGYSVTSNDAKRVMAKAESANLRQVIGKVVVTLPSGVDRVVASDTHLVIGEEISTTAQAFASVELVDQTRIDLSSATTLKLEKVERRESSLYLRSGRVDLNVPKVVGEERQVSVRTPDAWVTVRGTIFSVEVEERVQGTATIVRVSRGAVAVQHDGRELVLRNGERWSSRPAREVDSAQEPTKMPEVDESVVTKPAEERPTKASSLKQQNRLFALGLAARDRGDDKKAVYWFNRLMNEFPQSPLLPSAKAERKLAQQRLADSNAPERD